MGDTAGSDFAYGFSTTHWEQIEGARTSTPERRRAVLDELARRYWRPVYSYVRARGHHDADARDITQGFFTEIILGRDLFAQANANRGRFRPYLLHCLKNYLRDSRRRELAQRRSPEGSVLSLETCTFEGTTAPLGDGSTATPEEVFHRQWAADLLRTVLERLQSECQSDGLGEHLDIFEQRVVRPALQEDKPPSVDVFAERFGLTPKQVCNRTETIRRRFRRVLLDEVRATVTRQSDAEDELLALTNLLASRLS
mgnify:CR=1 FL=1